MDALRGSVRRRHEPGRAAVDERGAAHRDAASVDAWRTLSERTAFATRDAARVLGYPYGMGDRLAKMFPRPVLGKDPALGDCFEKSKDSKWAYAYNEAGELRKAYEEETDARRVLDAARKLEGLRRQTGVHAAAVVIGREPLLAAYGAMPRTSWVGSCGSVVFGIGDRPSWSVSDSLASSSAESVAPGAPGARATASLSFFASARASSASSPSCCSLDLEDVESGCDALQPSR